MYCWTLCLYKNLIYGSGFGVHICVLLCMCNYVFLEAGLGYR